MENAIEKVFYEISSRFIKLDKNNLLVMVILTSFLLQMINSSFSEIIFSFYFNLKCIYKIINK